MAQEPNFDLKDLTMGFGKKDIVKISLPKPFFHIKAKINFPETFLNLVKEYKLKS